MRRDTSPAGDGLVIVDKPAGMTSHDVVARIRRLAGTRRVGHAGTLDPMATGVLVVGIGRATKLLGHLTLTEKAYAATIRLGASTNTDDAEGETTATAPPESVVAVTDAAITAGVAKLTGPISQVPPQVSAIKVNGQRSYKRARAGETVELAARPVTVHTFTITAVRRDATHGGAVQDDPERVGAVQDAAVPDGGGEAVIDVDATVTCSSGTYIRALARDLGADLGVGGHLTALRRTRVGGYDLSVAHTLDELAETLHLLPIAEAAARAFPRRDVTADQARAVRHGGRLPATGRGPGPIAVFDPDGTLLALVEEHAGQARPLTVLAPA